MFRVKICGITNVDDALAVAEAGGDAIGLNCYARSMRYCKPDLARKIADALPPHVCKVGVFVNATADAVRTAAETIGLDLVQLHGDEPPEFLQQLRPLAVMKAFRLGVDLAPVGEYLRQCHRMACMPRMVLVDTLQPGQYGGTGATLDWQALAAARPHFAGAPLVLAGGLKPSNVAAAIAAVRPWAVDTASGVETSKGKKSAALIREFIVSAGMALATPAARQALR